MQRYKKVEFHREIITALYFLILFLIIGLFFGKGNIGLFIYKFMKAYSLKEVIIDVGNMLDVALKTGSLGETHDRILYENVVREYFTRSLLVVITAFVVSITLGMTKGVFDYRKSGSAFYFVGSGLTSFITSLPDFFFIIALQWIIIVNFPFVDWFGYDQWYNFLLPSVLVALYPMMYFARITTAALANEEGQVYIQTARSKGLREKIVTKRHILRKCLQSILQHVAPVMAYVLSNLLIVEWIMDFKGGAWRILMAIHRINDEKYREAGLVIEFSLCFMVLLCISQIISLIWQHKHAIEKSSVWWGAFKILIRYVFISLLIIILILFIER